jgi:proton glutamate symport protein
MRSLPLHWQIVAGMLIGAAAGLMLNVCVSQRESQLPQPQLPAGVREVMFRDSPGRIDIRVVFEDGTRRQLVVDPSRREPQSFTSLDALRHAEPRWFDAFQRHGRSWARWVGDWARRLGSLFLRMLQMVAVPLIAASLITGVLGLGRAEQLGRMFLLTLGYFIATTLLAIVIGLVMGNLIGPGLQTGSQPSGGGDVDTAAGNLLEVLFAQVEAMIPANPIAALADSHFLSIISFSLLFGVFTLMVGGSSARLLQQFFEAVLAVMMQMTLAVIRLCPAGVLLLMLHITATQGWDVFRSLGWYMLTVLLALGLHAAVILPAIVWLIGRRSPLQFARAMSPALLTAFSSASSNSTLPLTLANVQQRAGVSHRVSSFVLPLGATINMDGTALYQAVAVLFIGQLYHGFSLPLSQQIIVTFTALLASIGTAGIPHAGLVMMVIILQSVGLPVGMQGIILAVDRVLDMCRTSVNVWSDACGCAVIERLQPAGEAIRDHPPA